MSNTINNSGIVFVRLPHVKNACPKCGGPIWVRFKVDPFQFQTACDTGKVADASIDTIEPCKKCGYKAKEEEVYCFEAINK